MFEPTAGRLQLDIHSLLVNIYTDRYVGNEGIWQLHTILVFYYILNKLILLNFV